MRGLAALILFLLALPMAAMAAPNLQNCNVISSTCIDANSTKTIGGFPVHAACWEWEDINECDTKNPVDECSALSAVPDSCSKTSQNCANSAYGLCDKNLETWSCAAEYLQAPSQLTSNDSWSAAAVAAGADWTGASPLQHLGQTISPTAEECASQNSHCQAVSSSCISPAATHVIDGGLGQTASVSESCWQEEYVYSCPSGETIDDCGEFEDDAECSKQGEECIEGDDENCQHKVITYHCGGTDPNTDDEPQTCGSQQWCIGTDCTDVPTQDPNTRFGEAAAAMNLLQEMANDFEIDGDDVTVFAGKKEDCSKYILSLKNCCKVSGTLVDIGIAECSEGEKKLAVQRSAGQAYHVRNYCGKKTFFGCLKRTSEFCTFGSRLGRMIQEQGRAQLGISWNDCRGLTPDELQTIDWSQIDLSEALADIETSVVTPNPEALKSDLSKKIEDFYKNNSNASDADDTEEGDNASE